MLKQTKQACLFSKLLYNEATYLFRKSFFDEELLTWQQFDKILKHRSKNYNALPAAAQALLRQMGDNWKSFWNVFKDSDEDIRDYEILYIYEYVIHENEDFPAVDTQIALFPINDNNGVVFSEYPEF